MLTAEQRLFLKQCRDRYLSDLVQDIFPFWLRHGLDPKNGGVFTCLDRDGTLMDPTKSIWFQGRFGYTSAYAYNHIDKNPAYLAASKSCVQFLEKYGFDTDGHMFFTVTADGKPVRKRRYVFSESFAAIAFSEYALASGDDSYAQKALDVFLSMIRMLGTPGFLEPKTYIPTKDHSITMILLNVAACVRRAIQDPRLDAQIESSLYDIRHLFMKEEFKAVLEIVAPDGSLIDTCAGRVINPGHAIETSYFVLEEARYRKWDPQLIAMGTQILNWSWDWGWDKEYGGIINFRDCKHFPPQDYSQDMKFWWPQCEAIIASLYAYRATGDNQYLEKHRMIHEYAFRVFPDRTYGEWYGYLHRDGTVAQPAKGNIFKGPFHIPRMLMTGYQLCDEILNDNVIQFHVDNFLHIINQ